MVSLKYFFSIRSLATIPSLLAIVHQPSIRLYEGLNTCALSKNPGLSFDSSSQDTFIEEQHPHIHLKSIGKIIHLIYNQQPLIQMFKYIKKSKFKSEEGIDGLDFLLYFHANHIQYKSKVAHPMQSDNTCTDKNKLRVLGLQLQTQVILISNYYFVKINSHAKRKKIKFISCVRHLNQKVILINHTKIYPSIPMPASALLNRGTGMPLALTLNVNQQSALLWKTTNSNQKNKHSKQKFPN